MIINFGENQFCYVSKFFISIGSLMWLSCFIAETEMCYSKYLCDLLDCHWLTCIDNFEIGREVGRELIKIKVVQASVERCLTLLSASPALE